MVLEVIRLCRLRCNSSDPWAKEFHDYIKNVIVTRDFKVLIEFQTRQRYAFKAHPTPEHYIPLLCVAGPLMKRIKVTFHMERQRMEVLVC